MWTMQQKRNERHGNLISEYLKAKKAAKTDLYFAKRDAQTEQFASINNNSDKNCIFKMA